jgi:hypothetical protein
VKRKAEEGDTSKKRKRKQLEAEGKRYGGGRRKGDFPKIKAHRKITKRWGHEVV